MDKRNSCINKHTQKIKVGYLMYWMAEMDALVKQKEHPGKQYRPYKCDVCGNYHLTSSIPRKEQPNMDKQIRLEEEAHFWIKRLKKKKQ